MLACNWDGIVQGLHKNVAARPRGSYFDKMFIYRDFWDAFEEDEVDDDVFAEHEIFWSPRDLLVTSLQISAAAVLLLTTLLVLTLIQMSLIMLSRTSTNPQVRKQRVSFSIATVVAPKYRRLLDLFLHAFIDAVFGI